VEAKPSTELGHLRPPRHPVVCLPAVRRLELLLGETLLHAGIVVAAGYLITCERSRVMVRRSKRRMCFHAQEVGDRRAATLDLETPERYGLLVGSSVCMPRPLLLVASEGVSIPEAMSEARSFEEFFEGESRTLFRRLCLVTGNRQEAEEVMQDAFLKLFERWERVRGMDDPTGYLYRTAFNVFKKRSRRTALALRRTLGSAENVDEFAASDARSVVAGALSALTPRQRAAIVLTELLGYTSEAAGEVLGVRPVTIRVLASQGRATMKRTLEPRDG
jgi:RNA polymerase sigma-70 factor (ECF subfamily)